MNTNQPPSPHLSTRNAVNNRKECVSRPGGGAIGSRQRLGDDLGGSTPLGWRGSQKPDFSRDKGVTSGDSQNDGDWFSLTPSADP